MLIIIPIQSIPTRHKRWTFNTWRLHGHRYKPHTSLNPTTGLIFFNIKKYENIFKFRILFNDVNHQDQPVNVDNDIDDESYNMLLRLLQFFQILDREQKEKDNGNN